MDISHLEAEWDLTSSLPLRPVFEQGVDILLVNVMVLSERNTGW